MTLIGFWFCVFLHWVLVGFTMFYVFIRKSKVFDTIYFLAICTIIVSWFFTGSECIISYWEKVCLDHTYKYQSDTRLPFMEHVFPAMFHPIIFAFITLFTLYTLFRMMKLYNVPLPIMITILISYIKPIIPSAIKLITSK